MLEPHKERSNTLPVEWLNLGLEILEKKNLAEERYRSTIIRDRLLDCMAHINIKTLLGSDTPDEAMLNRMQWHRSTPNKWLNGQTVPNARMFFGILFVGLRKEITEVELPPKRIVIWEAVSHTLAIIRKRECGKKDYRCPSKREFFCVHHFMRHPWADELIPDRKNSNRSRITAVFRDICIRAQQSSPNLNIVNTRIVSQAITDWAEPYTLFCIGILNGWEFLDEHAV